MFFKSLVLQSASFALFAINVFLPSVVAYGVLSPKDQFSRDVQSINGFDYLGCYSAYDFNYVTPKFVDVDNSTFMTIEKCATDCADYGILALFGTLCSCGTNLHDPTSGQDIACNLACPGNANEICGGFFANATKGSTWFSAWKKTGNTASSSSLSASSASSTSSISSTSSAATTSSTSLPSTSSLTISTVWTTTVHTITSCGTSAGECSTKIGQLTTEVISIYTTVCPSTTSESVTSSSRPKSSVTTTNTVTTSRAAANATVSVVTTPTEVPFKGEAGSVGAANLRWIGLYVALIGLVLI